MNKFAVIAKNKETYFIKRLIEEVGQVPLFDPWSDFEMPEARIYFARTTGVYKNELDLMIMKSLPDVVNSHDVLKKFRRKSVQYQWFDELNIPALPWIYLKEVNAITAEKFTVLYPEVVVKPDMGQGGWGIEVLTRDTLKSWMKKHDHDYLLQPFIKGAVELRVFFIKGAESIVLERKARSGIAANFKNQGVATVSSMPEKFRPEIERLISLSGAHYGAIDLLIRDDAMFILELNSVPGIEQVEKVSGKNLMRLILNSLAD